MIDVIYKDESNKIILVERATPHERGAGMKRLPGEDGDIADSRGFFYNIFFNSCNSWTKFFEA